MNARDREAKRMDPRFNYAVQVLHEEGTSFFYRNAFTIRWGAWRIVIPEHHDIAIYHLDEAQVFMFERVKIEEVTDLTTIGIDETELEFGADPYGMLKRDAEDDEESSAEPSS